MAFEVKLPDIGEGVAEGEIVRWLVAVGDAVREDQPLVEVMTDKASVEIPSPRTGVIASLHAEQGEIVNVGAILITIEVAGDAAPAPATHAASTAHGGATAIATPTSPAAIAATPAIPATNSTTATAATGATRVQATPAVRQLAKQLGVALESIAGSGPGGAITAEDVKRSSAAGTGADAAPAGTSSGAPAMPAAASPAAAKPALDAHEERIPLRGLRRKIADHMRHSIDTAAHFTFVAECDMTELAAHRASLAKRAEAQGIKLTYLAYIVRALVRSLREYPVLNASLDDATSEIVIKQDLRIGIAVQTADGLTVPVVRDAESLTLLPLAKEIDRLAQAARAGKLKLEELQGGTFTLTSTGAKGGVLATPILHHPQVAILGVHEIKPKPAVLDGQIVIRDLGNLSLSLDHRVVDGAVGADFLYDLIARLESPSAWLTEQETA